MSPDDRRIPRFIVGMSRGGTTWMARSLNEHPEVCVFGETQFWARSYVPPNPDGSYDDEKLRRVLELIKQNPLDITVGAEGPGWMKRIKRPDLPAIIDDAFGEVRAPVTPEQVFLRLADALAAAEGKPLWIEKTPRHVNWADRILSRMPQARFVVMLREPYSFMLSYRYQESQKSGEIREGYAVRYHPLAVALIWRSYMRAALNLKSRCPEQVMLVQLEDIRRRPEQVLYKVQEFLRLEPDPALMGLPEGENTSFRGGARPQLPGAEIFWVNLIARREIRAGSFEPREPTRGTFLGVVRSILALPIWAVRAYANIKRRTQSSTVRYLWRWLFPA